MKQVLLVSVSTLGLMSVVNAADIAPKTSPALPPSVTTYVSPWDGPYIGGNVGWGRANLSETVSIPGLSQNASENGTGVLGGPTIGYNKTFNQFLLGLETDWDVTSINAGSNANVVTTKLDWLGTTRIRAGVLILPQWLIYGTGGVAYGKADTSLNSNIATLIGFPVTATSYGVGWAAGAGMEYAIGNGWSIGAEYIHSQLSGPSISAGKATFSTEADVDIGRGTVRFKF